MTKPIASLIASQIIYDAARAFLAETFLASGKRLGEVAHRAGMDERDVADIIMGRKKPDIEDVAILTVAITGRLLKLSLRDHVKKDEE